MGYSIEKMALMHALNRGMNIGYHNHLKISHKSTNVKVGKIMDYL